MMQYLQNVWMMERAMLPFTSELFSAAIVYVYLLRRKEHFALRVAAVGLFVLLSPFWWSLFVPKIELQFWILLYTLFCINVFAETIIGIRVCFKVRLSEALYCATCAYITEHIVYCLRILFNELTKTKMADSGGLWYFLLHIIIYLLAYRFIAKRMVQNHHYETGVLRSVGLMLVVLLIVYLMSVCSGIYGWNTIHAIYALVCCLFMLFSQCNQVAQLQMQKELHRKEQIWQKNKAQYEMSKETIEIINRKCHDLKHQIRALKGIENIQKQKEVVEGIEESVMIYDAIKNTGNTILDTVLTEKGLLCKEHNIQLNVIADGKLLDFMDEIDLYTLFGNALENAIESNLRIKQPQRRYINLQIREKLNLVLVRVENPYVGEIQMSGGIPQTMKKEKEEHGFGVRSMIHTAEEYGGIAKIETQNQVFVLRILFPHESAV